MPDSTIHAVGLAYHICDVFVPELRKALAQQPSSQQQQKQQEQLQQKTGSKRGRQQQQQQTATQERLPAAVLEILLEPFSSTLVQASEQAMLTRVRCVCVSVCVCGGGGGGVCGGMCVCVRKQAETRLGSARLYLSRGFCRIKGLTSSYCCT